jgi:hypothetical protein
MYEDELTTEEYYQEEEQAQEEAYYFHTIKEFEAVVKAFGANHVIQDLDRDTLVSLKTELNKFKLTGEA